MALKPPERPAPKEIPDDAILTQYGRVGADHPTFRSRPRFDLESDISLVLGRLTVDDATVMITGRVADNADRVRYLRAGDLRAAGFVVGSTPTKRNPDHVSVTVPEGAVPWDDRQQGLFEHCAGRQAGRQGGAR